MPFVYDELKRQARILMSAERADHTLQPTALVHEAYLRLAEQTGIDWENRRHFYAIASKLMRQILVDHARARTSGKRGGDFTVRFTPADVQIPVIERAASLLALDDSLKKLEIMDERQAKIVEMKFFGGLTHEEIADTLEISERTVGREWYSARLWLYRELEKN